MNFAVLTAAGAAIYAASKAFANIVADAAAKTAVKTAVKTAADAAFRLFIAHIFSFTGCISGFQPQTAVNFYLV